MIVTKDSHLDHGLTAAHVLHLLQTYADEKCDRVVRKGRAHYSRRLCTERFLDGERYENRRTYRLSVIAGPHDGHPVVLYTAFGGPIAPKEPGDPSIKESELDESRAFWKEHALVIPPALRVAP